MGFPVIFFCENIVCNHLFPFRNLFLFSDEIHCADNQHVIEHQLFFVPLHLKKKIAFVNKKRLLL